MLFIHLLIVIYLFVYLFTYSLLTHSFARSFIHSFIYFKVNLIDYMLDFTRFILQGVLAIVGESDHQTSNGEYDEDTSGFEDDRLSQSNDQAGDGQLQDNLSSDGNFIDDQENSGTSGDHRSDGGSDIQATELESGNYELDFSMEEELLFTRRFDEGYDVFDEKYVQWLKVHHPEKVASKNVVQLSANCLSSDTSQPTTNQLESCPAASETTLHSGLPNVNSTLPLPSNHNTPTSTGTDSVAIASNPINSPSTPKSHLCLRTKRTSLSNCSISNLLCHIPKQEKLESLRVTNV